MSEHSARALDVETSFLAGAEANMNQAKGLRLRGTRWAWTTRTHDDRLRELMTLRGQYDREMLRNLPRNRSRVLTGTYPRLLLGERRVSVAIATVLSPLEHYLSSDDPPPPVGLADLVAHVKGLVGEADVPHVVGVCSPSGFTDDARRSGLDLHNVTLVLVEPRASGGWMTTPLSPDATASDCKLFDPEGVARKLERIRQEVREHSADLLTGGLSAATIADRLGVPAKIVNAALEQIASTDPELRVSREREDVVLWRGAPAALEDSEMSMAEWVRQLFSREGNEARKINALSERRVKLVQRRDRIYADVAQLEAREATLLQQGRESASPSVKRRVASQIKQLRDDMGRLNSTAGMLGQQVDVISTHIHNLTLIQQGQTAKLPPTEEITQDAVRAEEMLEQLGADAELVSSLNNGVAHATTSEEELAILRELDGPVEAPAQRPRVASSEPLTAPESTKRGLQEPEAG